MHKLKELICAIVEHNFNEHGKSTCIEHGTTFDKYKICCRCGIEKHTGLKFCKDCFRQFSRDIT